MKCRSSGRSGRECAHLHRTNSCAPLGCTSVDLGQLEVGIRGNPRAGMLLENDLHVIGRPRSSPRGALKFARAHIVVNTAVTSRAELVIVPGWSHEAEIRRRDSYRVAPTALRSRTGIFLDSKESDPDRGRREQDGVIKKKDINQTVSYRISASGWSNCCNWTAHAIIAVALDSGEFGNTAA